VRDRKAEVLAHALKMAERYGYENIRRDELAAVSRVSAGRVSQLWTAAALRTAVMREAVARQNLRVVAQGLALRHSVAVNAPYSLRRAAADSIVGRR
jgi:hypothetical protein